MAAKVYAHIKITVDNGLSVGGLQATSTQAYVQTPWTKVQGSLCPIAMNIYYYSLTCVISPQWVRTHARVFAQAFPSTPPLLLHSLEYSFPARLCETFLTHPAVLCTDAMGSPKLPQSTGSRLPSQPEYPHHAPGNYLHSLAHFLFNWLTCYSVSCLFVCGRSPFHVCLHPQ